MTSLIARVLAGRDGLDDRPGQREPGRHRETVTNSPARGPPPSSRTSVSSYAFSSGTTCFIRVPSPRRRRRRRGRATPSAMRSVASRVPTTPGMPYSRATIAECESRPPLSVTIAPSRGSRMLNASVVDSVTEHVALDDPVELGGVRRCDGPVPRRHRGSPPAHAACPPHALLRNYRTPPPARYRWPASGAPAAGGKPGHVRRRRWRRTKRRRRLFRAVRCAILEPARQFVRGRLISGRTTGHASRRDRHRRNGLLRECAPSRRAADRPKVRRAA